MLKEFFTYGLPLVPSSLAGWALVVLDRFVLGYFRGAAEVGLYAVAYALGDKIMQLATMPLLLTMMPSIIGAYEKEGQSVAEQMQKHFTRYFAILTFPLLGGMMASAAVFMSVFTGPQYREAYPVLAIVAAGSMFGAMAQVAGAGLAVHKKTKLIMIDAVVAASCNLGLNMILVPRYGYMAAAWDTIASYAILLAVTWIQSRRYMRWHIPWADLARITGSTAVMAAVLVAMTRLLTPGLPLLAAELVVGAIVYFAVLLAVRGIRPEERAVAREALSQGMARLRGGKA
jgi:O-antigen/teichoic acid export membrane protein